MTQYKYDKIECLISFRNEVDRVVEKNGLSLVEVTRMANVSRQKLDALKKGIGTQEPIKRIADSLGINAYQFIPMLDQLNHETKPHTRKVKKPLDTWYNVDEPEEITTEETVVVAEVEDSLEYILEDFEHYIEQFQRVFERLKALKEKETGNDQ